MVYKSLKIDGWQFNDLKLQYCLILGRLTLTELQSFDPSHLHLYCLVRNVFLNVERERQNSIRIGVKRC